MTGSAQQLDGLEPYSYELPRSAVAQRPVYPPDSAKMMVVNRALGSLQHSTFAALGAFLKRGDHLVFNETKVVPARLFGRLPQAPDTEIELLLIEQQGPTRWLCMGRPLRKVRASGVVIFGDDLRADVVPSHHNDRVIVEFSSLAPTTPVAELLYRYGTMPIPLYIRSGHGDEQDRSDYQSIFAKHAGSIAAPTASLHFTPELINELVDALGCSVSRVTLHVGTASFQSMFVNGVLRPPPAEGFEVSSETLESLHETKERGGRVIAVGTTVTRALEGAARNDTTATQLFIRPGFDFRLIDALITNFHQPGTTHLLLVEALLGRKLLANCYESAMNENYRFLSYGDGMIIV